MSAASVSSQPIRAKANSWISQSTRHLCQERGKGSNLVWVPAGPPTKVNSRTVRQFVVDFGVENTGKGRHVPHERVYQDAQVLNMPPEDVFLE